MNTREKIMKNALELFVENGIDKTSTAKISSAAGLSSGALFVHFPTKQNLIEELYIDRKKCSMQDFSSVFDSEKNAEYNVRAISKKIIEYYAQHKSDFCFIRMVQNHPKISDRVLNLMKEEYIEHTQIMRLWIKNKEIKNIDPELLGNIWWGIMIPFIEKMQSDKIEKVKKSWMDFIWSSLKKEV